MIAEEHAQCPFVLSKGNEIHKVSKEQEVKYKIKESADINKATAEESSDLEAGLDAVME